MLSRWDPLWSVGDSSSDAASREDVVRGVDEEEELPALLFMDVISANRWQTADAVAAARLGGAIDAAVDSIVIQNRRARRQ